MPNIASVLKDEIRRIAKAESKKQLQVVQKSVSGYRKDIAALKRENAAIKKQLSAVAKGAGKPVSTKAAASSDASFDEPQRLRFSPASVKNHRKKLGLSAADYAKLIDVSPLTIYNWEHGKSRPRDKQLAALAEIRGIGKREATRRIEGMDGDSASTAPEKTTKKKTRKKKSSKKKA